MLWLKSYLECRVRLLLCVSMAASSTVALWMLLVDRMRDPRGRKPLTEELMWEMLVIAFGLFVYPLSAKILAGSGINTQTAWGMFRGFHPSTYFVLGLPVSRRRLVAVRTLVGLGMFVALVVAAQATHGVTGAWLGLPLGLSKALAVLPEYLVLGCLAYFVAAFLASFLDEVFSGTVSLMVWSGLVGYSLADGPGYANVLRYARQARLLEGNAEAWLQTVVYVAVCAVLYRAMVEIVERKEY